MYLLAWMFVPLDGHVARAGDVIPPYLPMSPLSLSLLAICVRSDRSRFANSHEHSARQRAPYHCDAEDDPWTPIFLTNA